MCIRRVCICLYVAQSECATTMATEWHRLFVEEIYPLNSLPYIFAEHNVYCTDCGGMRSGPFWVGKGSVRLTKDTNPYIHHKFTTYRHNFYGNKHKSLLCF